jgi:diguanylate cyclase
MQRSGRPACVVLVDIDHFKAVNDRFGHAAGDAVLKLTAKTLAAHTRATDTVARWGDEEFVLLLPETDLAAAQTVAEKCRLAVQALAPPLPGSISITLGVSEISPSDSFETALERADFATGKKQGRNRVVLG